MKEQTELVGRPHYPVAWVRWQALSKSGVAASELGVRSLVTKTSVQRFGARFRVAQAFQGVNLRGFSDRTLRGYTALLKVVLAWSAMEQLLNVLDMRPPAPPEWFPDGKVAEAIKSIKAADPLFTFYTFVHDNLDRGKSGQASRGALIALRDGGPFNASYLGSTIRHVFVHGHLPSTPKGVKPGALEKTCNVVASLVLTALDAQFVKMVDHAETASKIMGIGERPSTKL